MCIDCRYFTCLKIWKSVQDAEQTTPNSCHNKICNSAVVTPVTLVTGLEVLLRILGWFSVKIYLIMNCHVYWKLDRTGRHLCLIMSHHKGDFKLRQSIH